MTAKAAFVLGLALIVAAILHGGVYAPGHDFVVNRFTGTHQFVPSYDDAEGDDMNVRGGVRTLTSRRAAARVEALQCRR